MAYVGGLMSAQRYAEVIQVAKEGFDWADRSVTRFEAEGSTAMKEAAGTIRSMATSLLTQKSSAELMLAHCTT